MKKTIALILALVLLLGMTACGGDAVIGKTNKEDAAADVPVFQPETEPVAKELPEIPLESTEPAEAIKIEPSEPKITEFSSLQELNNNVGAHLNAPAVDGVVDTGYRLVDRGTFTYAEYAFTFSKMECFERFCPLYDQDISTSGMAGKSVLDMQNGDMQTVRDTDRWVARWTNTDGQYVLEILDEGVMDEEAFKTNAENIRTMSMNNNPAEQQSVYDAMAGEYADKTSQRATATVTAVEGCAEIVVRWSSSAKETTEWVMTVTRAEDGLLYYKDEVKKNNTYDDAGNLSSIIERENGEGWWSFGDDGLLRWTGAVDEDCRECVFEKIPAVSDPKA